MQIFFKSIFFLMVSVAATFQTQKDVSYTNVKGYSFVGQDDMPVMYYAISSQKEWEKLFQPCSGHHQLEVTPIDWKNQMVIALVKNGNEYWVMKPQKAYLDEGELLFEYQAHQNDKNMSWKAAVPLIILVPRGNYKAIQFVENGAIIRKIENFNGNREK
jgi:hypothetical protein